MPIKMNKIGHFVASGSIFNQYLCNLTLKIDDVPEPLKTIIETALTVPTGGAPLRHCGRGPAAMKPFRERNLVVIGLIGFVVIALVMLASFRADRLPIIGAGDTYKASFAEIGGLKEGNEVRVAGVSVGNVNGIELKGDHVDVTFKLDKGTELGKDTGAAIKVRTLLGAEFLALTPSGSGELAKGATIPLSRTVPPYNVVEAFSDLSTTTDELDVDEVSKALDALAEVAARTPKEFRGAIKGVSDLSANLAARDQQINTLLVNLKKVSTVLNATGPDLERLFKDATVLFDAISCAARGRAPAARLDDGDLQGAPRLGQGREVRPQAGSSAAGDRHRHAAPQRGEPRRSPAHRPRVRPRAGQLAGHRSVVGRLHQAGWRLMSIFTRFAGLAKVLTVFVVLALVAAVVLVFTRNGMERTLTVDFPRTNSLYKGSDVRILGVPVGEVKELKAQGDHVEVTLTYETDVRLPADVKAVIISPAIVGDRFVQLAPAYSGGAVLPDNAKLGVDRSEVPVELDEIFKSLDDLAIALGPKGANKDGSLSSLIEDTAKQFDGQGQQLHETLTNFAKLSTTLSDNKDELFGSIQEIEQFVALLNRNDSSVRSFFDSTARVSNVLENERDDLAKTLEFLSKALIDVRRLIKDNRTTLRHNVDNLQRSPRCWRGTTRTSSTRSSTPRSPWATSVSPAAAPRPGRWTLEPISERCSASIRDQETSPASSATAGRGLPVGEQLCPTLEDLLDGLLPEPRPRLREWPLSGGAAAGGAEPPTPDETVNGLTGLLGVNP